MHKLKAMVNRVFWAVFALWGLNLILEIEVLAIVTGWLLPILFIATFAFSFFSKTPKTIIETLIKTIYSTSATKHSHAWKKRSPTYRYGRQHI